jgi:hypothetical protein
VKRPAVGPFLATGVALVGAAAIVANPLVMPPEDIQVSAAEFAARGSQIDVLDPSFLASIGRAQEGYQAPVRVLESLLSGMVDKPGLDLSPLADTYARFIETGDPAALANAIIPPAVDAQQGGEVLSNVSSNSVIAAAPSGSGLLDELSNGGNAQEVVQALANIGTGFGDSGATFLKQVGLAPQVVAELAQRVGEGTLTPIEALRRLILLPLTGHPALTGNPSIDALFTTGVLQPLIDALVANLPAPFGQDGGLIQTVESGLEALGGVGEADPSTQALSVEADEETVVGDSDAADQDSESDSDAGELGNTNPLQAREPAPSSSSGGSGVQSQTGQPGGFAERIADTIDGFTGAFRSTVTGGNGQSGQTSTPGDAPGGEFGSPGGNSSAGGAGASGNGPGAGGAGSAPSSNDG